MIASLPPISATTRLSQIWPGCTSAASLLIPIPTSLEPVKETKRVFGWRTNVSPTVPPLPLRKLKTPAGRPTSSISAKNCQAIAGESLDGFTTTVLPATIAAVAMPTVIASGKFHGGMIAPAGELHHRLGLGVAQHLARVELHEVDRLGGVGVGLRPALADLEHHPR